MSFNLPQLPYAYNALEPTIDEKTMIIHHTKHHQAYINNLNNLLKDINWVDKSLDEILTSLDKAPANVRSGIRNNVGGTANHNFFWKCLSPTKTVPSEDLANALNDTFGTIDAFKEIFAKAATTRFGSGWAFLVLTQDKKLEVISTANQDSPISEGMTPLLALDVWEHAYYLNYQNRRPDYINAFWDIVNWDYVSELYAAAK